MQVKVILVRESGTCEKPGAKLKKLDLKYPNFVQNRPTKICC